jgi:hypothetical protein
MIDVKHAVIIDVEATPARTYDEVAATRTMIARAGSRLARGEGDIGGTLELSRGENCPRRRKSCSRIKSAPFCKRWLAKAWRSTCQPTQIYTHVLDERMKAMVRDLHPLIGE